MGLAGWSRAAIARLHASVTLPVTSLGLLSVWGTAFKEKAMSRLEMALSYHIL